MLSKDESMPDLLLRDLPPRLHARLKERAELNRRSMSAEAISMLEMGLAAPAPMSLEEIDRRRIHGFKPLTDEILEQARKERP